MGGKARITVTIDASVLRTIDKERGELITRSRYVDHVLKKGLLTLMKERTREEDANCE